MEKKTALIIELEVVHPCLNIDAMNKAKDKDAQVIMKGILGSDARGTSHIFTIKSSKSNELLNAHKAHPLTKGVDIISKSKDRVDFVLTSKPDIGIAHALAKSRCIPMEPVVTANDVDRLVLFAPSWGAYKEFINSLPETFECRIKKKKLLDEGVGMAFASFQAIGFLELEAAAGTLTERQLEILDAAILKGYYSSPRRITMSELAAYLDLSTPTLHEHLTKIEAKILPMITRILKTIK